LVQAKRQELQRQLAKAAERSPSSPRPAARAQPEATQETSRGAAMTSRMRSVRTLLVKNRLQMLKRQREEAPEAASSTGSAATGVLEVEDSESESRESRKGSCEGSSKISKPEQPQKEEDLHWWEQEKLKPRRQRHTHVKYNALADPERQVVAVAGGDWVHAARDISEWSRMGEQFVSTFD
ncbi:clpB, partial [Symbiodinium necroappetens]